MNNNKNTKRNQIWWAERALQGITYWIGHRHSMYSNYPLSEGALVAETCNLLKANLPRDIKLFCEIQYSKLFQNKETPLELKKCRADLVVGNKIKKTDKITPKFVFEVKRALSIAEMNKDLRRLAVFRNRYPSVHTYLFVIAENKRPKYFVNGKGNAIRMKNLKFKGQYNVKRVLKAGHSFSKIEHAHYACLIEVFSR